MKERLPRVARAARRRARCRRARARAEPFSGASARISH